MDESTPARRAKRARLAPFLTIADEQDVRQGVRALRRACPTMRRLHDLTGDPPVRHVGQGFEGLARIVVGQQLSVASAAAIWRRARAAVEPFEAARFLELEDAELRAVGLSAGKIRTLRALSTACVADGLNFASLDNESDATIRGRLTAISGIGPWTADIYLMFCLGRRDAWAPGDLALQVATQMALALDERPRAPELETLSERWRPWRGVAARLLWAYYAVARRHKPSQPL
jgi:DNA-3-methyladenine glycosylase II